ncbi:MAG: AAA family ATPase [Anaeromyxobacteraceae bacterium]
MLWIVGGPNGAGKSTVAVKHLDALIPVVSPDTIAAASSMTALEAGKAAIREQERLLAERAVFAIDTTFSGKRELDLLSRAKAAGYRVYLVFVGIDSPQDCLKRIEERVSNGGHDVAPEDVVRRYHRSMRNLALAAPVVDRLYLLDNALKARRLVLLMDRGRTRFLARHPPEWAREALPEFVRQRVRLSR